MNKVFVRLLVSLLLGLALSSCESPQAVGTNTNWMRLCNEDAQCGAELYCECGRCTSLCSESSECRQDAACSPAASARLQCRGKESLTCQPRCDDESDCETGRVCLGGVCTDALPPLDCPSEAFFCEDFEEGLGDDIVEVVTDGNTLTPGTAVTPSGDFALRVAVSDGPSVAYARAALQTQSSGQLFVSGWVRIPEQEAHNVAPLALWSSADEGWALRLVVTDARLELWSNTAPLTASFQLDRGSWHCLQMAVDVAEGPDGRVAVSVDGSEVETASETDTLPEGGIEAVAMGSLWAASAADLWVDRVIVSSAPIDCFD